MSSNFSKSQVEQSENYPNQNTLHSHWWMIFAIPAWVVVCFYTAQVIIGLLVWMIVQANIPIESINNTVLQAIFTVIVYLLAIVMVIGLPYLIRKYRTNRDEMGVTRYPSWKDILLAPAGLVIYFIISATLLYSISKIWPGFNIDQKQNIGFTGLSAQYQYILAFLSLVVVAPIAEELLFRGYLFGKLKKSFPIWLAILITSLVFGALHLFSSSPFAWNLFVDTFALSIILCLLRVMTGNIWSSVLLHMIKNGIAFYLYFISPLLLATLGK